jgi:hypothetical protein
MAETKIASEQKEEARERGFPTRPRANATCSLPYFDGRQSYEMGFSSDGEVFIVDDGCEETRLRDLKKRMKAKVQSVQLLLDDVTMRNVSPVTNRLERLTEELKSLYVEYQNLTEQN